jgi:2-keto-4-pentenoate hydratase/2-oxohepta-3-ene-1,7-dioic acid hydratase in catechol pathway
MKHLARTHTGKPLLGDPNGFVPLSAATPNCETVRDALSLAAAGSLPDVNDATADRIGRDEISFGSPLAKFGTLWGIGLNYADHAVDLDERRPEEPASFLQPRSAVTGPGGPIRLPPQSRSERVTVEAELAVVIGRTCRAVETETNSVMAGYLPVIDVTAEDILQRNPRFLTRAKSFDTFLIVGPAIAVPEPGFDLAELSIRTVVNGHVVAENELENMLFPPNEIVAFHSGVATLKPGDVFNTGTPGAGQVKPGFDVRAEVESVGSVEATVTR